MSLCKDCIYRFHATVKPIVAETTDEDEDDSTDNVVEGQDDRTVFNCILVPQLFHVLSKTEATEDQYITNDGYPNIEVCQHFVKGDIIHYGQTVEIEEDDD